MKNYIREANIRFVVEMILFIVIGMFIVGLIDKYEQKRVDVAYEEGYDEAVSEYGFDE
jgi:hypothetical protein